MRPRRQAGGDRGSFTAELAAGLPALVLLLAVGLSAVSAVVTKSECLDMARSVALATARGDRDAAALAGPPGAEVSVVVDGDLVTVTVRAPLRALGARLGPASVTASVTAAVEPGVTGTAAGATGNAGSSGSVTGGAVDGGDGAGSPPERHR
ncbi:TadE family type IV pilus minor pilin [Solwaraspora sp. WMMA2080]|uniref:TadE family type IV pilus minor pilin n=1 Tax=unclassified Solwaraspora TaxID=2627926 RepID=UPI00248C4E3B|nr:MULTISPECIES: TadE family type IV pilus minor pilin [unclassified Solwaraspora]WBB96553.1 TadE family type IV pilus minor pilin [Solwaraspora sp. WMMA2059]WBC19542.1 TadE family type IV pilus minor pilin [Solwaraspora sp. WMMA2080]